jgi:hypothetical protein
MQLVDPFNHYGTCKHFLIKHSKVDKKPTCCGGKPSSFGLAEKFCALFEKEASSTVCGSCQKYVRKNNLEK